MFMVITLVLTSVMGGNSRPDVAVCILISLFSKDVQWKGIVGPTWPCSVFKFTRCGCRWPALRQMTSSLYIAAAASTSLLLPLHRCCCSMCDLLIQ